MSSIAVLVAMEAELVHLRNLATSTSHRTIGVWDAYDLSIDGHEVLAVRSGIGMLNAASSTERVIAEYAPDDNPELWLRGRPSSRHHAR